MEGGGGGRGGSVRKFIGKGSCCCWSFLKVWFLLCRFRSGFECWFFLEEAEEKYEG